MYYLSSPLSVVEPLRDSSFDIDPRIGQVKKDLIKRRNNLRKLLDDNYINYLCPSSISGLDSNKETYIKTASFLADFNLIDKSDAIIVDLLELSWFTPSIGVYAEIGYAIALNKPVYCITPKNVFLHEMITNHPMFKSHVIMFNLTSELINFLIKIGDEKAVDLNRRSIR